MLEFFKKLFHRHQWIISHFVETTEGWYQLTNPYRTCKSCGKRQGSMMGKWLS